MRVRFVLFVGLSALLGFGAAVPAPAGAITKTRAKKVIVQPLRVAAATITQSGLQLTWTVELGQRFSPTGLKNDHRSVCLLLERPANDSVGAQMCIAPPAHSGAGPRLMFMHITAAGPGRAYDTGATITRGSPRELTATFTPTNFGLPYQPFRWQVISKEGSRVCTPSLKLKCYTVFPRRPALAALHTPQLVGCVPNGAPYVTNGPRNVHEIALTFDDGPWYDTPQFLDILEQNHVVATFFEIGEQISTYGQGGAIERRMLADGDMVGDHTWNHANVSGAGAFAYSEIAQTANAIEQATGGFTPCLFRAPGGAVSGALIGEARSMGFTTIEWDVDPRDWARPGTGSIESTVLGTAQNGSIILQHDGGGDRSETLAALPSEIATFRARGYQFVTVTQMLGDRLIYK